MQTRVVATMRSPAGALQATLSLAPDDRAMHFTPACPFVQLEFGGRAVLEPSRLGLEIGGQPSLVGGFEVTGVEEQQVDSTWEPVLGERRAVRDRYNGFTVTLRETISPGRVMALEFRVYDAAFAFRYRLPRQERLADFAVVAEHTSLRFPEEAEAYSEYWPEGPYVRGKVAYVRPRCFTPLTVAYSHATVAVYEAANVGSARMLLSPAGSNTLMTDLDGTVRGTTPWESPWRVVQVGRTPGELLEASDTILNLSDPCRLSDTGWIKPGPAIRDITLSTTGSLECIRFARSLGMRHVLLDWGWYGTAYDESSDARQVDVVDAMKGTPRPEHPGLDLPEVVRAARAAGIGVWLYVNHQAAERQIRELIPLYASWGVAGIKLGFVRVGAQEWTAWLHDVVRVAAEHRLMIDVHDDYRPTGFSRTYPNLLTQEGVCGNEHDPDARHNCTLPFTRFVIGAADYTPALLKPRGRNTWCHQLALGVVYYSPLQCLFWCTLPGEHEDPRELEFWRDLPTVWDETRVVVGDIGQRVAIARRKGDTWYLGAIVVEAERLLVPLRFLTAGITYAADIYRDLGPTPSPQTCVGRRVAKESRRVTATDGLDEDCFASGGVCARFTPARPVAAG
ncbi:MAG TPA: glycoside hydrolase family 97 catalytic domain-containing protein [Tepidisphaeraceae bacterium]|nr:glycoside hydrolase family 97 catalytic domain-containing protein [Tepidisphaeraceae bacterium]